MAYREHCSRIDVGAARRNTWSMEVWTRRKLFPEGLTELRRGECYNDFLKPNGIGNSMGFGSRASGGRPTLYLYREKFGTDAFGERGTALLRLLYPAFMAGMNSIHGIGGGETAC